MPIPAIVCRVDRSSPSPREVHYSVGKSCPGASNLAGYDGRRTERIANYDLVEENETSHYELEIRATCCDVGAEETEVCRCKDRIERFPDEASHTAAPTEEYGKVSAEGAVTVQRASL